MDLRLTSVCVALTCFLGCSLGAAQEAAPSPFGKTATPPAAGRRMPARLDRDHLPRVGAKYYPPESLRAKEQGRCIVAMTIGADGSLSNLSIQSSTGYPRLDQACLDAFAGGHMLPATVDGVPVEVTAAIPVVWTLNKQ